MGIYILKMIIYPTDIPTYGNQPLYGISSLFKYKIANEPIKFNLLDKIKDIRPTFLGDIILTLDSKLYTFGLLSGDINKTKELILKCENVKSIGGNDMLCFYLTWTNELWLYESNYPILISDNVVSACVVTEYKNLKGYKRKFNYLVYLTKNGCILIKHMNGTQKLNNEIFRFYKPYHIDTSCNILLIYSADGYIYQFGKDRDTFYHNTISHKITDDKFMFKRNLIEKALVSTRDDFNNDDFISLMNLIVPAKSEESNLSQSINQTRKITNIFCDAQYFTLL